MKVLTCAVIAVAALLLARPGEAQPSRDRASREGKLKVGDPAPDFTLKDPDGERTVKLSSFKDKAPVALVFASYT